ncbi:hypothetical protein [Pseudorhodoplanes sp.]|uniref:hypothetical protein n=1 Tax=Pseudorhodoplanes sp. TaxID=1934341 RepID=UPI003D0FC5A1
MTTLTAASPRISARSGATSFYLYMSLCCAAVAFIGFAPTYWLPLASKTLKVNPVVHVHGALFFSWSLFLVFQTWLASSGQIARHRSVGMIGVSFATAMTIFGTLVAINAMKEAAAIGMRSEGIAFAVVPLSGIAFFAIAFTLAVVYVRQPDVHKRLMLLAAISILDAAVARWFLTFLAPPGAVGPPPVAVAIPPAIVAWLLVVAAMVFDWRTRGRPHAVYAIGGTALLLIKLLNLPLSASQGWHAFAGGVLALAQ